MSMKAKIDELPKKSLKKSAKKSPKSPKASLKESPKRLSKKSPTESPSESPKSTPSFDQYHELLVQINNSLQGWFALFFRKQIDEDLTIIKR